MKLSKMYIHTLREIPNEAEIASHILLLRAGMIKKLVSGVYGFMPLGYRVLRKIENIVREEMNKKGAQEILMSALQPSELWKESGRWYAYGPELMRLKDRNEREFCLGPTHEEIFTDIVRNEVNSYRQLPINLYQIQTKYRDEKRPRFGLMRSREFIMKDAYSFDRDEAGLDKSYEEMYDAYEKIFNRCGLTYRAVEADTGAIGGSKSHEFTAISNTGESEIAYCEFCEFAATTERAECIDDNNYGTKSGQLALEEVHTPNIKTIDDLATFLNISKTKTIKAMLYKAYDKKVTNALIENANFEYVVAFIRGDRELNETKLINALDIPGHCLEFADEKDIGNSTGSIGGFTGPIGLKNCKIIVDSELSQSKDMVAGANKADYHIKNVNYDRDYKGDIVTDIKMIKAGNICPSCKKENGIKIDRGIEVGQVFKLGTKYSNAMKATYKDENMKEHDLVMGCYGIGISRTLAAIVEQNHDENGIIWPASVAPYHVIITLVKADDPKQMEVADEIYKSLIEQGIEVVIDDRDERPGVKFKDADLLGFPVRITVGRRAEEKIVEYKHRKDEIKSEVTADEAILYTVSYIKNG